MFINASGQIPLVGYEAGDCEQTDGDEFCQGRERIPFSLVLVGDLADGGGEVDLADEQENDDYAEEV